jgi:hypothetical protein
VAARFTFTRTAGTAITAAWANTLRDHVVPTTTSNDVSSEGQLAVNTSTDQLVVYTGSAALELARYGSLSSVTLTTTQSFGVTSNNAGGMSRNGTWCDANFQMYFTSNGSSGNAITIASTLPAPTYQMRVGDFTYVDAGTTVYEGSILLTTGSGLRFYAHNSSGGLLGANPSFAIAVGDELYMTIRYPVV